MANTIPHGLIYSILKRQMILPANEELLFWTRHCSRPEVAESDLLACYDEHEKYLNAYADYLKKYMETYHEEMKLYQNLLRKKLSCLRKFRDKMTRIKYSDEDYL